MTLLTDIGTFLNDATVSTQNLTLGTNLFLGREPDSPDTCVAIYEPSGSEPIDTFGDNTAPVLAIPNLQVRCRATTFATAESLSNDIWTLLTKVINETLTSTRYLKVSPNQTPFNLTRDSHDRSIFVCNFTVIKAT